MHPKSLRHLVRSLRESAGSAAGGVGDAELLDRFARGRDEAAFELLLYRHGPMVLAVCRRFLREPHDVEDAFQATFLALVRKAGSVRRGDALGGWLHRVACRVALRLRGDRARRAGREQAGVEQVTAPPPRDWGAADDLRGVLDEEVNRLPERQRAAFVLCCLEGKTGREAARQLGCSPGTVSSRLTRAREVLRRRLVRRGLAPAAVTAVALGGEAWAAVVPTVLVASTLKVSISFAAGTALPGRAASLAEGVLRAMFLSKVRLGTLVVLLAVALAAGGLITRRALTAAPPGDGAGPQAGEAENGPNPEKGRVVVAVVRPQSERVAWLTCHVVASEVARLAAPVSGVLKEVSVDLGDRVKKGQVLAVIDAPLLALEARQATAAVQQAKGGVDEAEAHVAAATAQVEAAQSVVFQREAEVKSAEAAVGYRQKLVERMKQLENAKSIPAATVMEKEGELEAAQAARAAATAALRNAKSDLEVQRCRVKQAEAAVQTARANLESAQVGLEKARYNLDLTRITSPVDGVVTDRSGSPGQYVRPGEHGGDFLLKVERTDRLRVETSVQHYDVPFTEPGAPVDLTFGLLPGENPSGYKVSRIGFVEQAEQMRVEIDVPNPDSSLRPGMSGEVGIHLPKAPPQELRIPQSCLLSGLGTPQNAVYVVRDGKAHRTEVQTGGFHLSEAVIVSGLHAQDRVVADPKGLTGDVVPVEVKEKGAGK